MSEILTFTRKMFDPVKPKAELVDIADIAHALSMLCRANGHFKAFYSVGQHSINCAREARARGYSRKIQLACLLHDASEAYLSDVTRPVKQEMPRYREIEEPLQALIWHKYLEVPLTKQEEDLVFEIDDAMLAHEFLTLMDMALVSPTPEICTVPNYRCADFVQCEQEFLRLFDRLTGKEADSI